MDSRRPVHFVRELFGSYGPDLIVLGVVVMFAIIAAVLVDWLHAVEAAGGVGAIVAARALLAVGEKAKRAASWCLARLVGLLVRPLLRLARWAFDLPGRPVVVGALLGLVVLVVWVTRAEPWFIAGIVLVIIGGAGHAWWFRAKHRAWREDNADIAAAPSFRRALAEVLRFR